ncbi:hypothetical protein ACRAWF_20270 [Streptomyces sp. L7]
MSVAPAAVAVRRGPLVVARRCAGRDRGGLRGGHGARPPRPGRGRARRDFEPSEGVLVRLPDRRRGGGGCRRLGRRAQGVGGPRGAGAVAGAGARRGVLRSPTSCSSATVARRVSGHCS